MNNDIFYNDTAGDYNLGPYEEPITERYITPYNASSFTENQNQPKRNAPDRKLPGEYNQIKTNSSMTLT